MRRGTGFDRVARAYRWLEYLTFGQALECCRLAEMARMRGARSALVLGDGDGRFTAALLAVNAEVSVVAIDSSPAMLELLAGRVRRMGASARLMILEGDAVRLVGSGTSWGHASADGRDGCRDGRSVQGNNTAPPGAEPAWAADCRGGFDLVVSHFFLDCLSTREVERLVGGVLRRVEPGALWVVSEFATPALWARLVVGLLYRGFAMLAGLRVRELPAYDAALAAHGFVRICERGRLHGLLRSTVWRAPGGEARLASVTEAARTAALAAAARVSN